MGLTVRTCWSTGPSLGAVEALTVRVVSRRSRPFNRWFRATVQSPKSDYVLGFSIEDWGHFTIKERQPPRHYVKHHSAPTPPDEMQPLQKGSHRLFILWFCTI